jgi:cytochrome c5
MAERMMVNLSGTGQEPEDIELREHLEALVKHVYVHPLVENGKKTFEGACAACHMTGVAGAPKVGEKAAWAPRLAQGKDALYEHAIKGKGVMPPKGGNAALSDGEVKAAVDHMVSLSK